MSGGKRLVYIPSINKDSWLLMSRRQETVRFRDPTDDTGTFLELHAREADELLARAIHEPIAENLGRIPITHRAFWESKIAFLNRVHLVGKSNGNVKLQDLFKGQCEEFVLNGEVPVVREIFEDWKARFAAVKESGKLGNRSFNGWDIENPLEKQRSLDHGFTWQAHLLENSRRGGEVHWIGTGDIRTDFSFVATELNLSIATAGNPFNPGRMNSINPDGLAVRRDDGFTLIEVKGPVDEHTLVSPMLQAACGALAVAAKAEMIVELTRTGTGRRPAYPKAKIPKSRPSLGLHILTAKESGPGKRPREMWSREIERACETVLAAFRQLDYIAYSFVVPDPAMPFEEVRVDRLITCAESES